MDYSNCNTVDEVLEVKASELKVNIVKLIPRYWSEYIFVWSYYDKAHDEIEIGIGLEIGHKFNTVIRPIKDVYTKLLCRYDFYNNEVVPLARDFSLLTYIKMLGTRS